MPVSFAFWDTSAIIPLCCAREFSFEARRQRRQFDESVIWWATPVEIHSGLDRLFREELLTESDLQVAQNTWTKFYLGSQIVKPDEDVLDIAVNIPAKYNLRAMDAIQLAAAVVWCGEKPRNR
jgi:predicted nucleic acid-binding protein